MVSADEVLVASAAIEPRPVLGQQVVDQLRRLIITRELPTGTHLVESQLSTNFAVSRGPVRDALRQLETEGLVESRKRGSFVIGLDVDDLEELYGLRQLLEGEVVRLCMRTPGERLTEAHAALGQMEQAAQRGDPASFAQADLEFHTAFYAHAGNRRLASIWQQYRPTFADMLAVTNTIDRDLGPIYEDHQNLLRAVSEGKEADVMPMLREHIDGSRRRMLSAYAQAAPPSSQ